MADLAQPLPYDDESFDDAVAMLVLHYLEDWSRPLAELLPPSEPDPTRFIGFIFFTLEAVS